MRAGFGIYLLLRQVIRDENLPLPRDVAGLQRRYGALRDRLNAAASPTSEAWRDFLSLLTPY